MTLPVVDVARSVPRRTDPSVAVGIPVAAEGSVPRQLGLSRAALTTHGFTGKLGQTLVVPAATGATLIAVGIGAAEALDAAGLRTAAASFVRAAGSRPTLVTTLADLPGVEARAAGQAVAEGALLASYRYTELKTAASGKGGNGANGRATAVSIVASEGRSRGVAAGVEAGVVTATAVSLARDLANTPPAHLTARGIATRAVEVAAASGLGIEVFDKDQLLQLGCGGIIGVNKGSVEPPRMIKLTYRPRNARGHLALVGKGVMYDSGGISLKPTDGMHVWMKLDMSGAAAVLATMSTLRALRCRTAVTAWLMCTDNMPSGSALKLGDVLTIRNGTTVEVHNTDAEGRLILADGLSLAVEEEPDAIVDIATLTGACVVALGERIAGVVGNDQGWVDQVRSASERTDEPVWQLPLAGQYRKLLDSNVADIRNVGGPYGGAITAAVFLGEFVGTVPWAHLDIAGPMKVDSDDGWLGKGATAFGTRLLIDLALNFRPPGPDR